MTLGTVTHQPPLSMGFFRQECWSGLPCPSPGDLLVPGIEPASLVSLALQAVSLPTEPSRKPIQRWPAWNYQLTGELWWARELMRMKSRCWKVVRTQADWCGKGGGRPGWHSASWLEQLSGCGLFVEREEKQISRFPLLFKDVALESWPFASTEYPKGNVQKRVEHRN